jgi:hypothetical protein
MSIQFAHSMTLPALPPFVEAAEKISPSTAHPKTVHMNPRSLLRSVKYLMDSWLGAMLGGGVYGAWAVWANWAQGTGTAFSIGAAHWLTSALLTFFGTMAMRQFFGQTQGWLGSLRAFSGGLALTYTSLFVVHGLLGTQHLLLTLAPGIVPNILFCGSYALLLKRNLNTGTL